MRHRCENWYLELNRKYIVKQVFFVWVVRYWRECKSHHDLDSIIVFQNSQILFATSMIEYLCDLTVKNSLDMSMQCQKLKMIEKSIRKIMHRMRANFCEHTSMQRVQIRTFLIWLKSVRESSRLVCEKIKYFQFFLIEFLLCKIEYVMTA